MAIYTRLRRPLLSLMVARGESRVTDALGARTVAAIIAAGAVCGGAAVFVTATVGYLPLFAGVGVVAGALIGLCAALVARAGFRARTSAGLSVPAWAAAIVFAVLWAGFAATTGATWQGITVSVVFGVVGIGAVTGVILRGRRQ